MKIAFLTSEYPGETTGTSGGIGTSIKNLGTALIEKGKSVTVFVYGQDKDEEINDSGIRIVRIKNVQFKGISWWLTRKKIERLINEYVSKKKIDLLEVADWTGISSFMHLKCPVVMRLHGTDTFFCQMENRPIKPWNKYLEKRAFEKADAIIAVSKFIGEKTNLLFNQKRRFSVIYNGIDVAKFTPAPATEFPNNKHILYFGTLIRKKGAMELPHIFNKVHALLPGTKLILAGGDTEDVFTGSVSTWENMKPLFNQNIIDKVSYVGQIPYTEMKTWIEKADLCIFPSYAEACPLSWLEAMAMRKAIVASNIGWSPEIIQDGRDGFLVHPADHDLYAKRIVEILNNPDLKLAVGTAASEKVANEFSNDISAEKSIAAYNSLLNQSSNF